MKAHKLLIMIMIATLAFNAANAQIHLPPHPPAPHGAPPPPKLHIKAPRWPKFKHPSRKRAALHRPPAPRPLPAPKHP